MSTVLNGTVTHGIRLTAVVDTFGHAVVGNRISRQAPLGKPIPLTLSKAAARLESHET